MRKTIKLFGFLASFAFAGSLSPVLADTATPAPTPAPTVVVTVNGMVDTYFAYNFANTYAGAGNSTVFFNNTDNSYTLGLAEASLNATMGSTSGHLTLAYGETAAIFNTVFPGPFNNLGDAQFAVEQAYVAYTTGQWTFSAGKFVTWMGNEVIESKSNWNYSRSLLFWDTIPLFHTGFSANYTTSDSKLGITGYVTNGWNNAVAITPDLGEKTYGLQVAIKPDTTFNVILNGIFGPNPFSATDPSTHMVGEAIVLYNATSALSFALDAEYGMQSVVGGGTTPTFWGIALYGRYQISSDYAAALRLEDLNDNGVVGLGDTVNAGQGMEGTLTFEHNLSSNMLVRLEGRYDTQNYNGAAVPVFNQGANTSQVTASASAVFSF